MKKRIDTLFYAKIKQPLCKFENFNKNNNLNFLRLLFAYIIVVSHSVKLSGVRYPLDLLFTRNISVPCFFIISGFVAMRSFWGSKSISEYLVKRCRRLLPAYVFAILFCAVVGVFFSDLSFMEYFESSQFYKYIISNLTFLNFLEPSLPGVFTENNITAVNGSLWSMKLVIGFYFCVPLFAYVLRNCNSIKKINLFLLFLYLFAFVYKHICLYLYEEFDRDIYLILEHQLPSYLQYFSIGIFCFVNFDFVKKNNNLFIFPAICLLIVCLVTENRYLLPIALASIIMFFAFNFSGLNNIVSKNDYSYGIYIYHFPIIQAIISLGYFEENKNFALVLVLISVYIFSYLSWNLMEKKILMKR